MFKKLLSLFAIITLSLFLSQCEHNPVSPVRRDLTPLEKQLVDSDNRFGIKLFKKVIEEEKDKNVFISPLSVSMALGMTLNGADGETKAAMEQTLELAGLTTDEINQSYRSLIDLLRQLDRKVIFEIANSIWYRQEMTFEPAFFETNQTYFDAVVEGVDFSDAEAAARRINAWVEDQTRGKIEEIIEALPYGDELFSMTILLPKPTVDADALIADLDHDLWRDWTSRFSERGVKLQFPKFKLEYKLNLNDILKALGMAVAFDKRAADFSRMYSGPENLYIDDVKHKTFVEVNEEGTEAAAVTSVEIGRESLDPEELSMRVDRPFLFVIREHRSETLLFIGKIVEPTYN